jgi:hypothetical protein
VVKVRSWRGAVALSLHTLRKIGATTIADRAVEFFNPLNS